MLRRYTLAACLLLLALPAGAGEIEFGRYHALVVGNNDYQVLPKLETAIADAEAVAEVLKKTYGFEVRLLRNASRADILKALNKYCAELTEEDNLLVFYAGHGWLDRESNTGFWQPVDAEAEDDLNWIANDDLTRRLNAMNARHVMIVADSCYSGALVRTANTELPTGTERQTWLERVAAKRSRAAIVSGSLEPVADAGRDGHSVFAATFLDALNDNKAPLEGTALFKQISRPVVVNADQTSQYADICKAGREGGEFIFVPIALSSTPEPKTSGGVATKPAPKAETEAVDKEIELTFWKVIEKSSNAADFQAYLKQFPKGSFVPLARARLAALPSGAAGRQDVEGRWQSEVLPNPFEKNEHYRLHFEFEVIAGQVTRRSTEDSKQRYPPTTRPVTEGRPAKRGSFLPRISRFSSARRPKSARRTTPARPMARATASSSRTVSAIRRSASRSNGRPEPKQ